MLSVVIVNAGIEAWDRLTVPAINSLNRFSNEPFELIVVDNGGNNRGDVNIDTMVCYAEAINAGVKKARGDYLLLLNNDITALGFWQPRLQDQPFHGPTLRVVEGNTYIEGWAIGINRDLWDSLCGFNPIYKNSWEDVDLSWRAERAGYPPKLLDNWPVLHSYNGTRQYIPGSDQWFWENREAFLKSR